MHCKLASAQDAFNVRRRRTALFVVVQGLVRVVENLYAGPAGLALLGRWFEVIMMGGGVIMDDVD